MRKAIGIFVINLLIGSGVLFGQIIVSSIVGHVVDSSGALVPDAQVLVTNTQTGFSVKAKTGSQGAYSVPGLTAGTYDVTVEMQGFQPYHVKGIAVASAETLRVDATLSINGAQQAVTVEGSAPIMHADTMGISGSVSTNQLADLPTSLQTIDALLQVAPGFMPYGANPTTGSTTPSVGGGAHWGSVNFTLNGMEVNDPVNGGPVTVQGAGGGSLVLPPPSALQELNIQS